MTEEANPMTCHELQAQLPEMIGAGESLAAHAHLQHCALCRACSPIWRPLPRPPARFSHRGAARQPVEADRIRYQRRKSRHRTG